MNAIMLYDFQTAEAVDDYVSAYASGIMKRLTNGMRTFDYNDADSAIVNAMLGVERPPSLPISSNQPVVDYARRRLIDALNQVLPQNNTSGIRLMSFIIDQPGLTLDSVQVDLRTSKTKLLKSIKEAASNYIAFFSLAVCDEKCTIVINVLGWDKDTDRPRIANQRRHGSRGLVTPDHTVELDRTPACLSQVATALLGSCYQEGPPLRFKKGKWKFKKEDEQIWEREMQCLILRASLNLDKLGFAQGDGKLVYQSLMRELKARVASLDLCGRTLVPKASLPRALADLWINAEGDRLKLPAIQHL